MQHRHIIRCTLAAAAAAAAAAEAAAAAVGGSSSSSSGGSSRSSSSSGGSRLPEPLSAQVRLTCRMYSVPATTCRQERRNYLYQAELSRESAVGRADQPPAGAAQRGTAQRSAGTMHSAAWTARCSTVHRAQHSASAAQHARRIPSLEQPAAAMFRLSPSRTQRSTAHHMEQHAQCSMRSAPWSSRRRRC